MLEEDSDLLQVDRESLTKFIGMMVVPLTGPLGTPTDVNKLLREHVSLAVTIMMIAKRYKTRNEQIEAENDITYRTILATSGRATDRGIKAMSIMDSQEYRHTTALRRYWETLASLIEPRLQVLTQLSNNLRQAERYDNQ